MSVRGHEATKRWFQAPDQERNWKTLRWKCFLSNCGNETWPSKRAYSGLRLLFLKNLLRLYSCGYVTLQGHTRNLYVELFQEPKQKKCKMRVLHFQWNICRCAFFFLVWVTVHLLMTWETSCTYRYPTSIQISSHTLLTRGERCEFGLWKTHWGCATRWRTREKKSEDGSLKKEFNSFITI